MKAILEAGVTSIHSFPNNTKAFQSGHQYATIVNMLLTEPRSVKSTMGVELCSWTELSLDDEVH